MAEILHLNVNNFSVMRVKITILVSYFMIFWSKECNSTIRFKSAPKKCKITEKYVKYSRHVAYQ